MRVALVNQPWSISPPDHSSDSIAIITYELSRRLAQMLGRISHVRTYGRALPDHPKIATLDGVEYRRISAPLDRLAKPFRLLDKWMLTPPGKPFYQSLFYHLEYAWHVARDLQSSRCDIVHIHNFPQAARIIKRLNPSIRVVLHMHCDWLTQLATRGVKRLLTDVDMVLGVSDYITNRVRDKFPEDAACCRTLYNGADLGRFEVEPAPGRSTGSHILFVGRISPEKGVHVLMNAFNILAARLPDATLDLIGPANVLSREFLDPARTNPILERIDGLFRRRDSYVPYLQKLLDPKVATRVRFLGGMTQDELAGHYASASLLVLPSIFDEPFGMPLAEAMAAGLPCVATQAGAFPEIVQHGRTGLLVQPDDPGELAAAMEYVLGNAATADAMGIAGRARAHQYFSWDEVARQLAEFYGSLITRPLVGAA